MKTLRYIIGSILFMVCAIFMFLACCLAPELAE